MDFYENYIEIPEQIDISLIFEWCNLNLDEESFSFDLESRVVYLKNEDDMLRLRLEIIS